MEKIEQQAHLCFVLEFAFLLESAMMIFPYPYLYSNHRFGLLVLMRPM